MSGSSEPTARRKGCKDSGLASTSDSPSDDSLSPVDSCDSPLRTSTPEPPPLKTRWPTPIPRDPWEQVTLTRKQAIEYLDLICLPESTLSGAPSVDLLARLLQSQLETIPIDTTLMHVPDSLWDSKDPTKPIELSSALLDMPEGIDAFDRIVRQRKGAFCFAVNPTFCAFLRTLGFRVSEVVGRAFKSLNNDPLTHPDGWKWGTLTHGLQVVDWPGSEKRYFVDAAWGPWSCPVPVALENGSTALGLNPYEAFRLVYEDLPLGPEQTAPIDTQAGWTMYRLVRPDPATASTPLALPLSSDTLLRFQGAFWTPQYHFDLISVPLLDFRLFHHFSTSHPVAVFYDFFIVSRLIAGTGGARRLLMYTDKPGMPRRAKVFTTGGDEARESLGSRDVEWVDMQVGPIRDYLEKEFGFKF